MGGLSPVVLDVLRDPPRGILGFLFDHRPRHMCDAGLPYIGNLAPPCRARSRPATLVKKSPNSFPSNARYAEVQLQRVPPPTRLSLGIGRHAGYISTGFH